ncbi:MAG: hypothetical protein R3C28_28750 [Pirellulaceae bacterium]
MIAVAAIILLGILQFAQSIAFRTSQRALPSLTNQNAESEQRSNYGEPSRDTTTTGKHPESTGYKDPNDASFRNPTELGKLRTSEGELDPEYLELDPNAKPPTESGTRSSKTQAWTSDLRRYGRRCDGRLGRYCGNHAEFGDATEEFLEFETALLFGKRSHVQ